ncbi:MAG: AAA family ATPase [Nitrososphaerota archaeon]|nr:AAA family ATPase [Candidatus Bathyarchaeota archaeon]MCX8161673.1 AAA family ATPase [Candidatus Bathyarchaeota archaeon]MDW8061648.1 AAA family ATPase [Nitrososphaerota archaeon]
MRELEELAVKSASEAVDYDRSGQYDRAIEKYSRAIEILSRICMYYPELPYIHVYKERIKAYQRRVEELRSKLQPQILGGGDYSRQTSTAILASKPSIRWDDIVDLEEAKKAIIEAIVYPLKRPDLFPLGWPRGILFFGPPGCGKTMLAAAVASEIEATFFNVDAATIMSKWLGESEKNVAALFSEAKGYTEKGKPAIIFIDEIDSIAGIRNQEVGGEVRVRNQLLKEMDGIFEKGRHSYVYVIGATNKPWDLDEPFIRRFQKRIYIPPPDYNGRLALLKKTTRNLTLEDDVDLEKIAKVTEGYTFHDLTELVREAYAIVVREFFETGRVDDPKSYPRPVSMKDFMDALSRRKPSVNNTTITRYQRWFEEYRAI